MTIIMQWIFAAICLCLMFVFARPAAAEAPVNLLRLPSVKLEATSLVGDQAGRGLALTDGKRETVASIESGGAETVDLVFGFAGEIVAPETIVVVLSKAPGRSPPARVEVLASMVSPQSGFKSLRADPIGKSKPVQTFAFMPSAARWIMVRLTLPKKAASFSLAEIEILGYPGEPKTNYAFRETPARVIDILARLEKSSAVSFAVSDDEKRVFEQARAGRLDPAAFAEAALLASGVFDPVKRKQYLDQIEAIAEKAKLATASAPEAKARADALLGWLHREVLKKGYRAPQTTLSGLLDGQTFNCVSSAVFYNIIALKLGIDVRGIEVPTHAFSIVYQGTSHWDVETTNAQGFNPSRDQIKSFERMTGFRYVADSHRDQRREVTEAGLVALIYYNRGVLLSEAKRHHEALLAYARAMSLDSQFASAAKNALATLANWSNELAKQKKWEQAIDVVTIGVELAPHEAVLVNNRVAIWNGWVISLAEAGRRDEAVTVLKRAAEAVPNGGFEALQSWLYIETGEELVKARKWDAAMSVAEEGLSKLASAPRQEVVTWRDNLYLRWADAETRSGRFQAASDIYARGITLIPEHTQLSGNVPYLFHEWARAALAKGGASAIVPVAREAAAKFPALPKAQEAVVNVVINAVNQNVSAGKFDNATTIVDQARTVLPPSTLKQLSEYSFNKWAEHYMQKKQWRNAVGIYDRGLKILPDSGLFAQNRAYCLAQSGAQAGN